VSVRIVTHAAGLTWVEESAMGRAAHALADGGRVWLVDPFDDRAALAAAAELGEAAGVIQLLDRHNRDCGALAERLGVRVLRLPETLPQTPFTPASVIANPLWREVALWWEERRTLVVAEAVGTVHAFALGRRLGVHPMLRLTPPRRALSARHPELVLVGHGEPLQSGGDAALADALDGARADIPKLLLTLPTMIRRS
jgi:hypothetical protein